VISERRRALFASAISGMRHPELYLFSLGWRPVSQLRNSITEFRRNLRAIRIGPLRGVRLVGIIEPNIPNLLHCNLHAHVVLDGPLTERTVRRIDRTWRAETHDTGTFGADPRSKPGVRSVFALAQYLSKRDDWCPLPGRLPTATLGILFRALHWQPMPVNWGTGARAPAAHVGPQKRRTFTVHTDEAAAIEEAMAHARMMNSKSTPADVLAFIAANYVLDETSYSGPQREGCLRAIERALGLNLVLVNPSDRTILRGRDVLDRVHVRFQGTAPPKDQHEIRSVQ
jgi:hypothetical protein